MRKEIQAYIAHTAACLTANGNETTIWDKDLGESIQVDEETLGFKLQKYPFKNECRANRSRSGVNHCLVDTDKDKHVCLSVYGKLFDGYDHTSTTHFSGMVYDDAVEIYDYSESDYFRLEKA